MCDQPCFIMLQPMFYLELINNIHCASDVTEWLPRWPENLKQAVKYEGYLC